MARLDAVLGRSPFDRAESSPPRESVPELWLDQDSPADHDMTSDRDKGAPGGHRRSPIRAWIGPKVRFWYRIPDALR